MAVPRGLFALEVHKLLIGRGMTQTELHALLVERAGYRGARQTVQSMVSGAAPVPVDLIDPIGSVLGVDDRWRRRLHRAAAMDRGYNVGME